MCKLWYDTATEKGYPVWKLLIKRQFLTSFETLASDRSNVNSDDTESGVVMKAFTGLLQHRLIVMKSESRGVISRRVISAARTSYVLTSKHPGA